ncbi:MAG: YebC/PmpR family DNA-binding transcriptional regulator, partial [Candidatus Jacksonbacteria bacterium]
MSGHSKWTQIKHQKGAADKKRGKLFSILSKRISIAARIDKDTDSNSLLKDAVERAKAVNMPNNTIERAVKRGVGELPGQGPIEEAVYEAYGPGGIQLIIIAATDNRNRTTANIRHILTKNGGSMSGQGSVIWNFETTANGFKAKTIQEIDQPLREKVNQLIEQLEEDEDVEEIYTN